MRLRVAVGVVAAILLVAGVVLTVTVNRLFVQLAVGGAGLLAGVLFEVRRYQHRAHSVGGWQMTDEKFLDPTTGHLMQVRFNPTTGERDYVDLGPRPAV